jgi:hypothetical protein
MTPKRACLSAALAPLAMSLLFAAAAVAGPATGRPKAPAKPSARAPAGALTMKCWTNQDGVRECGNAVPPEYTQAGYAEVLHSGAVRERPGAKTPEEIEHERALAEEKELRQRRLQERAEQDRVLLHTFTTEDDMVLTRNGKLAVIDSRTQLAQSRIADLERSREKLEGQAAKEERAGTGMSATLRADLDGVDRQIAENRQYIAQQRRDREELQARFEADLARFRGLKSGKVKAGDLPPEDAPAETR